MGEQIQSKQGFKRTLKLYHLTLFGLAYLTPMIVYGIYGIISTETHGVEAGAYVTAIVAMLFTALSYCHMVRAYPVAGSAYTYTRKAISPKLGFMIGWAVLLDYIFIPMAIWLIGASFFNAAFPSIPPWAWGLILYHCYDLDQHSRSKNWCRCQRCDGTDPVVGHFRFCCLHNKGHHEWHGRRNFIIIETFLQS